MLNYLCILPYQLDVHCQLQMPPGDVERAGGDQWDYGVLGNSWLPGADGAWEVDVATLNSQFVSGDPCVQGQVLSHVFMVQWAFQ